MLDVVCIGICRLKRGPWWTGRGETQRRTSSFSSAKCFVCPGCGIRNRSVVTSTTEDGVRALQMIATEARCYQTTPSPKPCIPPQISVTLLWRQGYSSVHYWDHFGYMCSLQYGANQVIKNVKEVSKQRKMRFECIFTTPTPGTTTRMPS